MKIRTSSLFLASSALVSSYIILLVADFLPHFYAVAYRATASDVRNFIMMPPTRIACENAWIFAAGIILIFMGTVAGMKHKPASTPQITVVALCGQGAVFWVAMFCFCYNGFCGGMSLHHGPEFDQLEFLCFGAGVFPITLLALLAPIATMIIHRNEKKDTIE